MLSEGFWVFLVGTSAGILGVILKLCYESKCNRVKCCCLEIDRNVETEFAEDKFKIEHNIPSPKIEMPIYKKEKFQDAV